jgi:uridine kinase
VTCIIVQIGLTSQRFAIIYGERMWINKSHKIHTLLYKKKAAQGILNAHNPSFSTPYVVGVCGGSGSGKTTFCKQFLELLGSERVLLISQDAYYRDFANLPFEERAQKNFDHPDSVEFELLSRHLDDLYMGRAIVLPQYDFKTHMRMSARELSSPKPIILIEGILLFSSPDILKRLDHKIFISTPEDIRFKRRLDRDIRERERTYESVHSQFESTVRPMHDLFVEPALKNADQIISGETSFDGEIKSLCLKILHEMTH